MLRALEIRNLLLIDRLDLLFQPGLNVLTGETGAGKSILLDSLGFVLGWRGRADLVRQGAPQGEVTAVFDLPADHPAQGVLAEAGLPAGDELILRRVTTPEGRKTGWVNDRRVSGEVLRALSARLVELHGQHDDRGLLNPRGHRMLLDAYADHAPLLAATRAAWSAVQKTRARLEEARAHLAEIAREEEFLRHAVRELDALNPAPGEEAELDSRRRAMMGAEKVRADIARAHAALGSEGAEGLVADALRWLEGALEASGGRLDGPLAALGQALDALGEAERGIADCLEALDFEPADLERIEERLFSIRGLARKHGVAPDDLGGFAADLRARLARLEDGAADLRQLETAVAEARRRYDSAAAALGESRRSAARRLDQAMAAELPPLRLERAVFATDLAPADPGPEGADSVAFCVATNPGAPAGPIDRIASGGELSRFLLALKVCLSAGSQGVTMIFDEIDRGLGGGTADAVGRRLQALARGAQVLVVTHSPQVAALGAHHWRVEKRVEGESTLSQVHPLSPDERVDEIARMVAGDTITPAARAAARALLTGGA